jgi:hypothetical protein
VTAVLYDCLTQDKPEALVIYMAVLEMLQQLDTGATNAKQLLDNFRLVLDHSARREGNFTGIAPLLQEDFIQAVRVKVEECLARVSPTHIRDYVLGTTTAPAPTSSVGCFLSFYGIPPRDIVQFVFKTMESSKSRASFIAGCAKLKEMKSDAAVSPAALIKLASILCK